MSNHFCHNIFLFFFPFIAFSQNQEFRALKKYTTIDGLSSYNVRKIIRDNKGFTWIATQEGLNRFDGKNFISYTQNDTTKRKLAGSDIHEIIDDTENNTIWVLATEGGFNGIDILTGNIIKTVKIKYADPNAFNVSMAIIKNKLWIGSFIGVKIYDLKKESFEKDLLLPLSANFHPGDYEASRIFNDSYENIWVWFCGIGMAIYDHRDFTLIKTIPINQFNDHLKTGNIRCNDILFISKNELLLATSQGLRKISFSPSYEIKIDINPSISVQSLNTDGIESIERAGKENILVAALSGFYKFNDKLDKYNFITENRDDQGSNWFHSIHDIFYGEDSSIWIGNQQGVGYFVDDQPKFRAFYYDNKTKKSLEHVRSITKLDSVSLLVGTLNGLATVFEKKNHIHIYDPNNTYYHVFIDPFGRRLVSKSDGMFVYQNNKVIAIDEIYPEFKKYKRNPTNSHILLGDSVLILGTENEKGILIWNYKQHNVDEFKNTDSSHSFNVVNNVYLDKRNRVWVLSDKLLTILDSKLNQIKSFPIFNNETHEQIIFYFDMCEADGFFWITAYGSGLIKLDSAFNVLSIFNTNDGLSNDGVYQVFPIGNLLAITSNNGLSVLNIRAKKFKNYYHRDGLHSDNFEEVAGVFKDGVIYAGGIKGFTEINPQNFTYNTRPPLLYIDDIIVETKNKRIDSSHLYLKNFPIPNDYTQVTIRFSGINYRNPEQTTFAYRIKELHKDWINLNNQNFITLIGLSPGTYHLQVQAFNEDGVPSEIKELTLVFLPKWYQTLGFKIIGLLIIAAIFYSLYKFRITQLKKEEKIRIQVASDLHDELGSTLNSIKVFTNLAMMEKENTSHLEKIKEATQSAIAGVKDIIWVLDDKRDTLDHLLNRIDQFAKPICEVAGISYKQQSGGDENYRLGKEEKRNLYMIIKESINNSIKYADCSVIELLIKNKGAKLSISISDNGKGFDRNEITSGYGLKNITHRAAEIGYHAEINSSPGNGTLIYLEKE